MGMMPLLYWQEHEGQEEQTLRHKLDAYVPEREHAHGEEGQQVNLLIPEVWRLECN